MDACALAVGLPLTPRAAAVIPSRNRAPPPHAQPSDAGRAVVALVCSLRACAAPRELLRERVGLGADAEARGSALAAWNCGFDTDLALATRARHSPLATALSVRSTCDGVGFVLDFPMATRCFAAEPDAGVQRALRRGVSVVCRAYPLGAASPVRTLGQPSSPRAGPMLPSAFRMISRKYHLTRCDVEKNSGGVTEKKKAGIRKWDIHVVVAAIAIGYRFVVYVADRLSLREYLSARVKLPEKLAVAAALLLAIGKSAYAVSKETKEFSEFILYWLALYKERMDAIGASGAASAATAPTPDVSTDSISDVATSATS